MDNETGVKMLHLSPDLLSAEDVAVNQVDVDDAENYVDPAFVELLENYLDSIPIGNVAESLAGPSTNDVVTMVAPPAVVSVASTGMQTEAQVLPSMRRRSTQTPRSETLYLPVSMRQLVRSVRESNGESVAAILGKMALDFNGFRDDQLQILTIVLTSMVETRRDLVQTVVQAQQAAQEAERVRPGQGLYVVTELQHRMEAELRRPSPDPWPRTRDEVDVELIQLCTPGLARAYQEETAPVSREFIVIYSE